MSGILNNSCNFNNDFELYGSYGGNDIDECSFGVGDGRSNKGVLGYDLSCII